MFNEWHEKTKQNDRNIKELWRQFGELVGKVNGLYKQDKHGTIRPKVEMLDDDVFRDMRTMETDIYELQEKVEKLEKKK